MNQLALGKILMNVGDLPALPQITNRIIELTADPESTNQEICDLINRDQVLVAKVLKLVNSAYYGLPRKVASVSEAVALLGMQTLRTLVVGASVYKTLAGMKKKSVGNYEEIWRHALACAVSSRLVATELVISQKDHAFTAGLLHDIGRVILATLCTDRYQKVYELAEVRGCPLIEAEQEILETSHAEVGTIIAHKWNLPLTLIDPIGYHHEPFANCDNQELVQMVYLGNIAARLAGYGSDSCDHFTLNDSVIKQWGINYEMLHLVAEKVKGNISLDLI